MKQAGLPPWRYNNKVLTEIPTDKVGFIYEIVFSNGRKYIGKKNFFHLRTLKPLKGKKRKRKKQVCSGWPDYVGSIKDETFVADYKANKIQVVSRTILSIHRTNLAYNEVKAMFKHNVLEDVTYYNTNILGRYYRHTII